MVVRLDRLIQSSESRGGELLSLQKEVELLTSGTRVSDFTEKAQRQLLKLITAPIKAHSAVKQRFILDSLRFEGVNNRFEDVLPAHAKTFEWILSLETKSSESMEGTSEGLSSDETRSLELREGFGSLFHGWLTSEAGIFHVSGKPVLESLH